MPSQPTASEGTFTLMGSTAVIFKAACPDCRGHFELASDAFRLAIGATRRTTFYSFTCPACGTAVRKPAGERIVELMTGGGVRTLRLHST
jgi:PHP family Zn ribbon phosphoesterase